MPFDGKKGSLFDLLEDLDYDDCLAKSQAIAGASGKRPQGKQQVDPNPNPNPSSRTP